MFLRYDYLGLGGLCTFNLDAEATYTGGQERSIYLWIQRLPSKMESMVYLWILSG